MYFHILTLEIFEHLPPRVLFSNGIATNFALYNRLRMKMFNVYIASVVEHQHLGDIYWVFL